MTKPQVRYFHPEVRLKKLLAEAGGVRAGVALERAAAGLQSIREDCLAAVDGKIGRLTELIASEEQDRFAMSYPLANEIFAEAGAFELHELSAVALSLCALLAAPDVARIPIKAITVHVDAMRALRKPEIAGSAALRKAVLGELQALAVRYGEVESKGPAAPQ